MSSSFFRAFNERFFPVTTRPAWGTFVGRLIDTVVPASS